MIPLRERLKEAKKEPINQKKAKVPTEAKSTAFEKAYTMDATSDAIIQICLEVYKKGSELEKRLYQNVCAEMLLMQLIL